jgi:hypothetical protein
MLSNEEVIKQLKDILDGEFYFETWNTTSVSHILIALMGHNGSEGKELSLKIFEIFLSWYEKNKQDKYLPESGMEYMYSKQCCRNLLNIAKNNCDMSEEEIGKLFNNEINKDEKRKTTRINFNSCNYFKKIIIITIIGGIFIKIML